MALPARLKFLKNRYSDDLKVLEGIKDGEEGLLELIYFEYYPLVNQYIKSNSGTVEDTEEFLQRGMIALWENIQRDKIDPSKASSGKFQLKSYLMQIIRNLWLKEIRGKKNYNSEVPQNISDGHVPTTLEQEEKESNTRVVIDQLLEMIGERCKKILVLSFYENLSMTKIAEKMGYESEQVARNQKYKCLKTFVKKGKSRISPEILQSLR